MQRQCFNCDTPTADKETWQQPQYGTTITRPLYKECKAKKRKLLDDFLQKSRFTMGNGMPRDKTNKKLLALLDTPEKHRLIRGMNPNDSFSKIINDEP